jgi:hypothetical protein
MKQLQLLIVVALSAGCAKPGPEFVQGNVRITTPVKKRDSATAMDGGTEFISIRDAKGRVFEVYIDHRLGTWTPGAIYLNAYPGKSNSVQVLDVRDFKQKVGDFD